MNIYSPQYQLARQHSRIKATSWKASLALIAIAVFMTGCSVNPVSGNKEFVMMSNQQEVSLGASLNKQVLKQYKIYNNAALQAYVNQIGQSLARHSHRNDIRYYFKVVDDTSINAFALPGGYIYITRGLMAYFNSEAELAGVLAHEIGHVTARHSARQHTRDTLSSVLASVVANKAGNAQVINQLRVASVRGFGRKHELQADQLGAEYLARAGYDPQNMIKVIEVLKSQEDFSKFLAKSEGKQPPTYHGTFATHPSNDKRLQQVVGAANSFKSSNTRPDNRRGYLNRISGLKYNKTKTVLGQIRVVTARPGDTFASLSRSSGIPKYAEQKIRLLNGMFPKGEPRPGQLIKVVQ